jgi:hypothetical protein
MNDDQLMTAVRDSFADVRLDAPAEQAVRRGQVLRGRGRAYRTAGAIGVAALAGAAVLVVNGVGRTTVNIPVITGPPQALTAPSGFGTPRASAVAGASQGATLDDWTVTKGPDGAINVTVRQLENAAGLQSALRADGIPVQVAFQPGELSDTPPLPADCADVAMSDEANAKLQAKILGNAIPTTFSEGIALTIYPQQIPSGVGIYLAIQSGSNSHAWGWGLDLVQATQACTG